ncbi:helix-turn-helix domain-containing protein [Haloechinothrix alba]|uniref:helix-turn-helix domain-containing protein n=1 Tax=Haloechinothrix alba TaxID=664784 RepID=UPI001C3C7E0C
MLHANAPLSIEGRRRLVGRCQTRPIAHVAAETGISRACASKWVNRWRRHGDAGLLDQSPHRDPAPDQTRPGQAPVHRSRRRQQPQARQDHCPLARAHGPPGREEGRTDPPRRRLAYPWP